MESTELKLVEDKEAPQELLTQAEIAQKLGRAKGTVSKLLAEAGLTPVIEANDTLGVAAKYDYTSFLYFLEGKKKNAIVAPVMADPNAKALVCSNIIQEMRDDKSAEGTEAIINNAKGFLLMLTERLAELHALNQEQAKAIEALEAKLDLLHGYATVKKVKLLTGNDYAWRPLKMYCQTHKLEVKTAEDVNYGTVNAYPWEAWAEVHGVAF